MLKIWYGRENSDREKFIYESIEKDGGLAMVIVPDQYTLEAERQAFRYMNSGVLMDVEVLSLSRLGQRLLKKTGLEIRSLPLSLVCRILPDFNLCPESLDQCSHEFLPVLRRRRCVARLTSVLTCNDPPSCEGGSCSKVAPD